MLLSDNCCGTHYFGCGIKGVLIPRIIIKKSSTMPETKESKSYLKPTIDFALQIKKSSPPKVLSADLSTANIDFLKADPKSHLP